MAFFLYCINRNEVEREKRREEIDSLLVLQAQADPPPTFPEKHKHRNDSTTCP